MKRVYGRFCSRHNEAVNFYKELLTKDKRFKAFIKVRHSHQHIFVIYHSIPFGKILILVFVMLYIFTASVLKKYFLVIQTWLFSAIYCACYCFNHGTTVSVTLSSISFVLNSLCFFSFCKCMKIFYKSHITLETVFVLIIMTLQLLAFHGCQIHNDSKL